MTMKTCNRCHAKKHVGEFFRNHLMGDGHLKQCKACTRSSQQTYRATRPGGAKAERQSRYLRELEIGSRTRVAPQKYGQDPDSHRRASLKYMQKRKVQTVALTELDEFVIDEAIRLRLLRERATGIEWHIDHVVPLNHKLASGLHNAFNVEVVPAVWNLAKGNRSMASFWPMRGM